MNDVPIGALIGALILLLMVSAFFSSSETGMMALNRYRLRHMARDGHRGAQRASALLERPDRLIGLILLGNNFVNIMATTVATLLALKLFGEIGVVLAPIVLTVVVLIFAEVAPKTLAAMYPERIAYPASWVLTLLMWPLYPVVVSIGWLGNGLLRLFRVDTSRMDDEPLTGEELRTVVNEAGAMVSRRFKRMLVSILDLEKVTVEDIMVPRNEITGIDLNDENHEIIDQLVHCQHTRMPVYRGDINNISGMLHIRRLLPGIGRRGFDVDDLPQLIEEPYFVPEGTPLDVQLRNFQRQQQRIGLVVDEYGDIRGLVTLEDLLEEVVGEFTTDPSDIATDIHPQEDGSYLVDGATHVRELNRALGWSLPTDGPKTLNGLIIEHMESIPEPGTSILVEDHPLEVVHVTNSAVRTVRARPRLERHRA